MASVTTKNQKNEREATRYEGIYQRVFHDQKHEDKSVVSFTIDYYTTHTQKSVSEKLSVDRTETT